jgi:hypothetical protein
MHQSNRFAARRGLLGRGALLVAGALGLGAAAQSGGIRTIAAAPEKASSVLRLNGRSWHLVSQDRLPGELPVQGDRLTMFGELFDEAGGRKLGEFYAACFCTASPFGANPQAAANVEMHTLNLLDGTLVGMGAATAGENVYAIVGGTGRFAGATGSYVARQYPIELGGDGTAEFVVTLTK